MSGIKIKEDSRRIGDEIVNERGLKEKGMVLGLENKRCRRGKRKVDEKDCKIVNASN